MAAQHAAKFWMSLLRRFTFEGQAYGRGFFLLLFCFRTNGTIQR